MMDTFEDVENTEENVSDLRLLEIIIRSNLRNRLTKNRKKIW